MAIARGESALKGTRARAEGGSEQGGEREGGKEGGREGEKDCQHASLSRQRKKTNKELE